MVKNKKETNKRKKFNIAYMHMNLEDKQTKPITSRDWLPHKYTDLTFQTSEEK